jgi:hypothetical protein
MASYSRASISRSGSVRPLHVHLAGHKAAGLESMGSPVSVEFCSFDLPCISSQSFVKSKYLTVSESEASFCSAKLRIPTNRSRVSTTIKNQGQHVCPLSEASTITTIWQPSSRHADAVSPCQTAACIYEARAGLHHSPAYLKSR